MASYIIGDIHGCINTLQALLDQLNFSDNDTLYLTGDLVNRGKHSLAVLRFVQRLSGAKVVLGNHDLHALALYSKELEWHKPHTLNELLEAEDAPQLMTWLRHQPLLLVEPEAKLILAHAGIHPDWTVDQALSLTAEVSNLLQQDDWSKHFSKLYGDLPNQWTESLTGLDRLRCITNVVTRMRFLDASLKLDFTQTGPLGSQPKGLVPWFHIEHKHPGYTVAFGHWAALQGQVTAQGIIALDGGCVYGGKLLAYDLANHKVISQAFCD
jgi:bis(5'-nucleosyl)-tetraphosphatase (symmetrical)